MKKLVVFLMGLFIVSVAMAKDYSQYANPEALVSPEKAKKIMESNKNVVVFDVRRSAEFMVGHIPGAVDIWRNDISADKNEYPFGGMRATVEKMENVLGQYGVDSNTHILIYDAKADYDAARLWWILDMYGHEKISLIDGGIDGWKAAGLSLEVGFAKKKDKKVYNFNKKTDYSKLAYLNDVKQAVENKKTIIVDTRSEKEHLGRVTKKGAFRPGRIPSKTFIPWETAVHNDSDKTFKSISQLKEIYAEHGIDSNSQVIAYCQSGVRSAHTTFVLTQLLGYKKVRNFDGSWIEWSYNKKLPADKG
ncbi:sulfurtransferase [Ilyobacter polytropus]|uniref:Sulfurtransferase n=1 Tax=Ilyobacter polytropus (strain ATCC 51220 / DSM 2926 / LMG 16218 / CuHBu1) TaxID=572544 RepID=E3HC04_ILYPC|nr:sulfurtransferase [Ilyobacter polytropus]ADO84330.1 Rhodanese domain protein [Ilyobacter polytropus DSM 2926]